MQSDVRSRLALVPCEVTNARARPTASPTTEAWRGSQICPFFKTSVLSYLNMRSQLCSMFKATYRLQRRPKARRTVRRDITTGNCIFFHLFSNISKQTIQLLLLRDAPRGLFESRVSVSRLVSWHFCGLERQCYSRLGVEGTYACKTKSKDLHSTYSSRRKVIPVAIMSPCVPTYPLRE